MKKKYPFIKQQNLKECAAASLWMIIRYYKGNVPIQKLNEMLKTTKKGTTAYNIVKVLETLGFKTEAIKTNNLENTKVPFIVHTVIDNIYPHFMVVYEINNKYIILADPATNIKKINHLDFLKIWTGIKIKMHPTRPIINIKEKKINVMFSLTKKYRKSIIFLGFISLLITMLSIISSFLFQSLIDTTNNINVIRSFVLLSLMYCMISFYRNQGLVKLISKMEKNMLEKSYLKILSLPYLYYYNHTSGEIINKFNNLNQVKSSIYQSIISIFVDIPLVLFSSLTIFLINKKMFIVPITTLLLFTISKILFTKKISDQTIIVRNNYSIINSYLTESLVGYTTIKGLNIKEKIYDKYKNKYKIYQSNSEKLNFLYNRQMLINDLIEHFTKFFSLILGIILYQQSQITIPLLITCIYILNLFISSSRTLISLDINIKDSHNILHEILNLQTEKESEENNINDNISLSNINYSYDGINMTLKNLNLFIKKGNKVLITGTNGSGKSTLLKIIKGYLKIEGNYLIGNQTFKSNKRILYVSYNDYIFTDTFYNNLTIKNNKDLEKIKEICYIENIINNLDLGYNTLLEENAFNLSAGQRQQLLLARSLQNFDILLIDESLNSMQSDLERKILKKLFKNYNNKTIIIVSHRLDNLDLFNQYVKLDKGKVITNVTYKRKESYDIRK